MKKLFIIDDTLSNKITYYHLVAFLTFLPFNFFYSELALISLGVHTLIHVKKRDVKNVLKPGVIFLQAVFFLTLLSTIYAHNKHEGFSLLVRQLAIFIFPILLFLSPINFHKYRANILSIFALTCIGTILYLYADAMRVIHFYQMKPSSLFSSYFINHNFSSPIGLHATYLSMYAALSLLYLLWTLNQPNSFYKKIVIIAGILILSAGLVQLASRAVLIAVLISSCIIFPLFFLKGKQRIIHFIIETLILLMVLSAIFFSDSFKNRYVTQLETDLQNKDQEYAINNTRMQRWDLAWQVIKEKPLFGHGTGDEVDLLRKEYFAHKYYSAFVFRLNAHNQYLSFLIKCGMAGLLIYFFLLIYGIKKALKNHDFTFLSFIIILCVVSLSENYLDVNKGIFFYSFFFSFFIKAQKKAAPALHRPAPLSNQQQPIAVSTY